MQEDNPKKNSFTYRLAPVVEVFASVQFTDIEQLKAAHIAEIWQGFGGRAAYPHNEEYPPLPKQQPGLGGFSFSTKPPLNRQWFMNVDRSILLQLQKDRLSCNWQKIGSQDYPRYEKVIRTFQEVHGKLWSFIGTQEWPLPRIEQLELGYVNIIPLNAFSDGEDLSNIGHIFRDVAWEKNIRFLPSPNRMNLEWQFPMPENLFTGHVQIITVQNPEDGRSALRFGLHATGGMPSEQNAMHTWFDKAHRWIIHAFDDLITPAIQKHWEKQS